MTQYAQGGPVGGAGGFWLDGCTPRYVGPMTAAKLADTSDPRFTADQLAHLAAFESAVTPPEVREARAVEEVARAICEADADVDDVRWSWDDTGEATRIHYRHIAAAAVAAYRAAQDGGAEEAPYCVRMGQTCTGVCPECRPDLRAALAPQAGDGAR